MGPATLCPVCCESCWLSDPRPTWFACMYHIPRTDVCLVCIALLCAGEWKSEQLSEDIIVFQGLLISEKLLSCDLIYYLDLHFLYSSAYTTVLLVVIGHWLVYLHVGSSHTSSSCLSPRVKLQIWSIHLPNSWFKVPFAVGSGGGFCSEDMLFSLLSVKMTHIFACYLLQWGIHFYLSIFTVVLLKSVQPLNWSFSSKTLWNIVEFCLHILILLEKAWHNCSANSS